MILSKIFVKAGPTICPAEPAAVVNPRTRDLLSEVTERPTTAKMGPKPVPAIPQPITIFKSWWASGVTAPLLINKPKAYNEPPKNMAFLSPNFSAIALKKGVAIPQAKFWIAIARENSALGYKNSSAIGIWKSPKEARIPKLISKIILPANMTGVNNEELCLFIDN